MKITPSSNETFSTMFISRDWTNAKQFNFDDIGVALTLLEVLSFKGWFDVRDVLIKALEPVYTICMHVYMFMSCMIGLTLFVGVTSAKLWITYRDRLLLTSVQRNWYDLKTRLKMVEPLYLPPRPKKGVCAFAYDVSQNMDFKRIVAVSVFVNSGLLVVACSHFSPYTDLLDPMLVLVTLVSVVQVVVKNLAFTPRMYLRNPCNRCDLLDTLASCIWILMYFILKNDLTNFVGFMVVVLRLLTTIGKHATFKKLMLTVGVSACKSLILFGMILLVFFSLSRIFSEGNERWAKFSSPVPSVAMLFRIVKGENNITDDCKVEPPFCTPEFIYWETNCGSFTVSLAYFCCFYIIITYIVLKLLGAIIKEHFSLFYIHEEDRPILSYSDIKIFQNAWNIVDVEHRGALPIRKVKFVLALLTGRISFYENKGRLLFKHMCYELQLLHNGKDVTFHEVLKSLSYRTILIENTLPRKELIARQKMELLIERQVATQTICTWLEECLRKIRTNLIII